MAFPITAFLVLVVALAVGIAALNEKEPEIENMMTEGEFEITPQNQRFFGWLPLPKIPVPCRTAANCCQAQCMPMHTCVPNAAIGAVCMPATGPIAMGTPCRSLQTCAACNSFTCASPNPCNPAMGVVCPVMQ